MTNLIRSTQLEKPDREKRGIERKCNFIIDLRCYKLFHCTVGLMIEPISKGSIGTPDCILISSSFLFLGETKNTPKRLYPIAQIGPRESFCPPPPPPLLSTGWIWPAIAVQHYTKDLRFLCNIRKSVVKLPDLNKIVLNSMWGHWSTIKSISITVHCARCPKAPSGGGPRLS